MRDGVVIAGGGLAAQRCAERLRRAGFDGRLTMICGEPCAPYDRPPLSKDFLAGKTTDPPRLRPEAWYDENNVTLLVGRAATRLRAGERRLELDDGRELRYDRLLIATGAAPRMVDDWRRFENVHVLRTLGDALRLRQRLVAGVRLTVVGAGFIGQEVAATARSLGVEVTLVEAMRAPLAHILGDDAGDWFARLHRTEGVDVRVGAGVRRLRGARRAREVELEDGAIVACDEVVVGIGVAPAISWLAGSGLGSRGGVAADAAGRTHLPGVYAAGDCAGSQHWEAAVQQGRAAALAMLGQAVAPASPAGFWSDLYGLRVNWVGDGRGADAAEVDGNPGARDFAVIYRLRGSVVAGLLVGRPHALPALRRRIGERCLEEGGERWRTRRESTSSRAPRTATVP